MTNSGVGLSQFFSKRMKMSSPIRRAYDEIRETIDLDFWRWAFGFEFHEKFLDDGIDLAKAWNGRHVEQIKLEAAADHAAALDFMEKIWIKEGYPTGK